MTAESKRLKIICLISLFYGIAEIVSGFVIKADLGVSILTAFAPMVTGILSLVLGVYAARAANVPSNAKKIRTFALVITLLSCAATGAALYLGGGFTNFAIVCVVGTIADLLVVTSAHQVKRALDRV